MESTRDWRDVVYQQDIPKEQLKPFLQWIAKMGQNTLVCETPEGEKLAYNGVDYARWLYHWERGEVPKDYLL